MNYEFIQMLMQFVAFILFYFGSKQFVSNGLLITLSFIYREKIRWT